MVSNGTPGPLFCPPSAAQGPAKLWDGGSFLELLVLEGAGRHALNFITAPPLPMALVMIFISVDCGRRTEGWDVGTSTEGCMHVE